MGAGGTGAQAEKGEELTAVGTRGEGGLAQVQRQARRLLGDGTDRAGWRGLGRGGAVGKQGSGTVQSWAQAPLPAGSLQPALSRVGEMDMRALALALASGGRGWPGGWQKGCPLVW